MSARYFVIPDNRGHVCLTPPVLKHLYSFAQIKKNDKEAGGQLFSDSPSDSLVMVAIATGPYDEDRRSRNSFNPALERVNADREHFFSRGLYSVGLWHTHPQKIPIPSPQDKETTQKYLRASNGEMEGFLQIIVGNKGTPPNLSVWLATTNKKYYWVRLKEFGGFVSQWN